MHLTKLVKENYPVFWHAIFIAGLIPLIILIWEFWTDNLGINKLDRLTRFTGFWSINFLLISLAITPVRRWLTALMINYRASYRKRLGDRNFLIQIRRMIGVFSFFYATLHVIIFLWLDLGFELGWIVIEVQEKPYLAAGMLAFLLLIPLAATSTNAAMRYLGKNWRRLHRVVYRVGIVAVLHYIWLSKKGVEEAYIYAAILTILLSDRLLIKLGYLKYRTKDDGMETTER
jgi:sulfoxide reductase heme-binding subunit YedZ